MLSLVLVAALWVFNNTPIGVSVKCHLLGDGGACIEEVFLRALAPDVSSSHSGTPVSAGEPCALQLQNHDASILVGTGGAGCETIRAELASIGTWLDIDTRTAASVGTQLCEGDWEGIHVQVLDTGGQIYGAEACHALGLSS